MVDWSAKGRRQSTPFSQFASLPSSYGRQWSMVDWYCVWVASRGLGSLGDPSSSSPPFLVPLPSGSFVVSPNGILSVHVGGAFFRRLPNLLNQRGTFRNLYTTLSFFFYFPTQCHPVSSVHVNFPCVSGRSGYLKNIRLYLSSIRSFAPTTSGSPRVWGRAGILLFLFSWGAFVLCGNKKRTFAKSKKNMFSYSFEMKMKQSYMHFDLIQYSTFSLNSFARKIF